MLWIPQSVPEITKYKIHFNHSREIEFLPLQVKFLSFSYGKLQIHIEVERIL